MEKTLIFKIPFYGLNEYIWEVYYKGGYYTVERPENIFKKTFFSGALEECKAYLRDMAEREFGFLPNFVELK